MPLASQAFERALKWTLSWEGGYSHDPDDPGGETKYGISKRSYPDLTISALTIADAALIYRRDFWEPLSLDCVPPRVAGKVFDMAVNMGRDRAVVITQKAINYLLPRGREIAVDGRMGQATIEALGWFMGALELDLLWALRAYHAQHYLRLVEAPSARFEKFARGWMRRAMADE